MANNECIELKIIKYKSMLLSGNADEVKETVENLSTLDNFLEDEKKTFSSEPWTKLDKTTKLQKMKLFVTTFCKDNADMNEKTLYNFLATNLDRKKLLKAKEVIYDKEIGLITSIPGLFYVNTTKKFTLKRSDKRPSTLKSLAPKRNKSKITDKIDLNNP
jgi:hypothetical protein